MSKRLVAIALLGALIVAAPARAARAPDPPAQVGGAGSTALSPPWLVPPVDGPITRGWIAPAFDFGPGHRGLDYAVPEGTLERAGAAGTVAFAGVVGGVRAVTLQHSGGLESTYSSLASTFVRTGESVVQGQWIGRSDRAHLDAAEGVHFGVKLNGDYVDPTAYLGPVGLAGAIHLAPTMWRPPDFLTEGFRSAFADAGTSRSVCRPLESIGPAPPPPNDNVAVAVSGIGSQTAGALAAEIYEHGPEQLGYPRASIYRFSYAGASGPLLHEPFTRIDTYRDLRSAAHLLRRLLLRVAERAPGRHVDLIAHSQGGIVARLFLQSLQRSWNPRLPVVDHLVTFSTPHTGAPLAGDIQGLDGTFAGGFALDSLARFAQDGAPWPDPRSRAAAQLAPGSELMTAMAKEDISFGTRALALGIANDLVVPADRSRLPHERSRIVGPSGLNGHSGILTSPDALATAYAFLRDARPTCTGSWDVWGPRFGRAISWGESRLPGLVSSAETAIGGLAASWKLRQRIRGGDRQWPPGLRAGNR